MSRTGKELPATWAVAALMALLLLGSLLRLEALVVGHGPLPLGDVAIRAQTGLAALADRLHPESVRWPQNRTYGGDPLAYLSNAREMTWFYQARGREPLFNYATKLMLGLTGDADVAVSGASSIFSVLMIPATFLVGWLAFGQAVGLGAALFVAIEPKLIVWGVDGWRDDAFSVTLLLFTAACLFFRRSPGKPAAVALGVSAALAALTRLTSASFVLPALLLLVAEGGLGNPHTRWPRVRMLAVSVGLVVVLVSPYLVNCWLEYGDPLVAVNRNTDFYRERAGETVDSQISARQYIVSMATGRPMATLDRVARGFTTYPFNNKWRSLNPWWPDLGWLASRLALVGLGMFAWTSSGRWLLMLYFLSMLPYVFTWEIRGGAEWRFTMHVYPIYFIAAALAFVSVVRIISGRLPERPYWPFLAKAAASGGAYALLAAILLWLPAPRALEALDHGERIEIAAGRRDWIFFRTDWYQPVRLGDVTVRHSRGKQARLWLPLAGDRSLVVTMWLDSASASPGAQQRIRVSMGDRRLENILVAPPAERIGRYSFLVPRRLLRRGLTAILLEAAVAYDLGEVDTPGPPSNPGEQTSIRLAAVRIAPLVGPRRSISE